MITFKLITKTLFGVLFIAAGANHFINPKFYESIMPPYLPWPYQLVIVSGIAEIVLGIGLLIPQTSQYAAWGLTLLLIAVFPANIYMATHQELFTSIPAIFHWIRLPLQAVLVLWAFWYTRPV